MTDSDQEPKPEANNRLTWDSNGQPVSEQFGDVYFSKQNGLEESRYVFIQHNQLAERFSNLQANDHFTVGETGFGTGLNFLACWQTWQNNAAPLARLTFVSVEKYPLSPSELKRSMALWPELSEYSEALSAAYEQQFIPTKHPAYYQFEFDRVRLVLIIDDAESALYQLLSSKHWDMGSRHWHGVDAWFLDGFAPAKNPDMWSSSLLSLIAHLSRTGGSFATFTAVGQVRRQLMALGFDVSKVPGYGSKRDMLIGSKTHSVESNPVKRDEETPWASIRHYRPQQRSKVAIIGAGLAGCHTASALAKRGFDVSVYDSRKGLALAASGNPQGVVYAKLSNEHQVLAEFNLAALLHAQASYTEFWRDHPESGEQCGVLQLSQSPATQALHDKVMDAFSGSQWIQQLNQEQASLQAGISLKHGALFFPKCGWIKPRDLCQLLLAHPSIRLETDTHITQLTYDNHCWYLNGSQHKSDKKEDWQSPAFDTVIIASANDAKYIKQCEWLPTKPIRGQVSYIETNAMLEQLNSVVCSRGYIAPAIQPNPIHPAFHAIGASFNLHDQSESLYDKEHQQNIQHMQQCFAHMDSIALVQQDAPGRVGFRCTSPDYLPLVGPSPNKESFFKDFAALSKNARTVIPAQGQYFPNLYLNIGHGSRGLTYAPLAAEILACLIAGDAPPCSQTIIKGLNPARFLIRDLIRRQSH